MQSPARMLNWYAQADLEDLIAAWELMLDAICARAEVPASGSILTGFFVQTSRCGISLECFLNDDLTRNRVRRRTKTIYNEHSINFASGYVR